MVIVRLEGEDEKFNHPRSFYLMYLLIPDVGGGGAGALMNFILAIIVVFSIVSLNAGMSAKTTVLRTISRIPLAEQKLE